MPKHRAYSLVVAVALLVAAMAGLRAAEPDAASSDPPLGSLLIAAATMPDPRFHHAVVLLLKHDRQGAFGIIVNQPIGKRPIAALLAEAGGKDAPAPGQGSGKAEASIEVYFGGPVGTELGFILHSGEYRRPETVAVNQNIAMTASRDILRDIGLGKGPKKYLFALGYAGWGAGQLEAEIARRDWFSTPADPALVFDTDPDKLWGEAFARRTREL